MLRRARAPAPDVVVRIGVIGLGQRIAHVLMAMDDVGWPFELAGFVDPEPIGQPLLERRGLRIGRSYADTAALLRDGPFDLLMIGSPNHLHFEHLTAALLAGCPIFAEKPIVRTEDESLALARLLKEPGLPPIFIGLVMRSMPIVREVVARVHAGALGEVISIDATEHLPPEHGGYLARNWRRRQAWGGSFMLDKVCHDFDIFALIAGGRIKSVASFGGRRIFHPGRVDPPQHYEDGSPAYASFDPGWKGAASVFDSDMDVADHQVAIAAYETGVSLAFHSNSHVSLQERRWYVAGADGSLIADLVRNKLIFRRTLDRGRPERIDFAVRTADNHNGADQSMALDLRESLERQAPFPVSPLQSLEAGLTVMAVDQAMASGVMVDCEPMWRRYDQACGF